LVVNPVRSRQTAKQLTGMEEALQQLNVRYDLAFTERKGHGIAPATRAVEEGYETIIAVGGDGTVNEVVNGACGDGGLKVAPKAKMDDGVLDVLAIGEVHWLQICALLTKIWRGTHIEDARTGYFGAREVEVEAERDTRVSVDGEVIGHTPVRLSVVPRALKVRCSAGTG